jgi:DNA-binding response OmpR family regulator
MRILVVDDSANIRAMVAGYLTGEGYDVYTAADGRQALAAAAERPPDLVILDLMMPELDGYGFLTAFRQASDAPVLVLTARLEEGDKVAGLDLGADDYVTKPFGLAELAARVRALLRRRAPVLVAEPEAPLAVGEVQLDRAGRLATVAGQRVDLTPSEAGLLALLMASPGRVVSRLEILTALQGSPDAGYERTVDVHVRNLRQKIEPDPRRPRYVETVYGSGYRFRPPEPAESADPADPAG